MKLNPRMLSKLGPNGAFGLAMTEIPSKYDNLGVFTADLRSFSGLDRFAKAYPDKFFNVGIAEQNLIGMAAGYASEGNIAYATTYASFACMRCLDQVSVNMAYMQLNVKLVGMSSGFSTGILGATHTCLADLAIMQALPNITILSPADGLETYKATVAAAAIDGPVYIRLTGAQDSPIVYREDFDYKPGKANLLREGEDITLIATGSMVSVAMNAAEILSNKGIRCSVLDMHTIRPLDEKAVLNAGRQGCVVTVEEHGITGGLGSTVCQLFSREKMNTHVLNIGVPCEYSKAARYRSFLDKYDLTPAAVADRIKTYIADLD